MIRPQAGLLLRSLGAGGGARPAAMRSATSLLLGAALATAFFLLYTALCRDIGGSPGTPPPPRWEREAGKAVDTGGATAADREVRRDLNPKQRQHAAEEEGRKEEVTTRGDGGGGGHGGGGEDEESGRDSKQEEQPQRIVMPATSTPTTKQVIRLPLSPSFLCHC